MSSKAKRKSIILEIILIISALVLGALIIVMVWRNKTTQIIEPQRTIAGSFPSPVELMEEDKQVYFAYVPVPDFIFNRMNGVSFKEDTPVAREDLRYLKVLYWGIDNKPHQGELIVHKAIAEDLVDIFYKLYRAGYPIEGIQLIDTFGANDEISMTKNNTSCFNGRKIAGTDKWSMHAYGLAIDINPLYNPQVLSDGTVLPIAGEAYADREASFLYKIDEKDYAYKLFTEHGFTWGGDFNSSKDYQHFEKKIDTEDTME